jgi:Putative adhesin
MTFMSETGNPGYPAGASRASVPLRMTPGRWVVLALTLPVAIALIGWTGFSLVGLVAKGSYSFSYPVTVHNGQVNVNVNGDNVTMRQAPGAAARVTGTVEYGLLRPGLTESNTANGTVLSVNCDGINSNCNVNDTFDVPTGTAVTLNTGGGDAAASGLTDTVKLWTDGGNVSTSNMTGDLQFNTGGGDLTGSGLNSGPSGNLLLNTDGGNINGSDLTGDMQIATGGGDLTGNGFTGSNLQVVTDGGNVNVNAVNSPHAYVQSGGGDVTLMFTQPPGNLQIIADGGNVNVILPQGITRYNISTPSLNGGNANYPSALASPTSRNIIAINSGGGNVTITQAS